MRSILDFGVFMNLVFEPVTLVTGTDTLHYGFLWSLCYIIASECIRHQLVLFSYYVYVYV
jgi:hypothetical protein